MSEAFREHRPLLCEDLSEEENFTQHPRKYRPLYRGRAKSSVKGAAAIITRWPEHWSSSLTYWWIGLSMMALTTFVIYNSVIAFALLPTAHMRPTRLRSLTKIDNSNMVSRLPEIYMHIFTDSYDDIDLDKYLPYIEIISNKHLDFIFNLFFIFNDTHHAASTLSAEQTNEIAMSSLWTKEHFYKRKHTSQKNIKIRKVALSHYLDESPLKKDWRRLPSHFMEFLVKAVSIWDKGGIAINPDILTPRSPHVYYIEKLQNILQNYKMSKENVSSEQPNVRKYVNKHKDKFKKKVNNIRDIIDILELEGGNNFPQENLTEAEDKNIIVLHNGRKLLSSPKILPSKNRTNMGVSDNVIILPSIPLYSTINETDNLNQKEYSNTNIRTHEEPGALEIMNESFDDLSEKSNKGKLSILPLFLEFLFHDKSEITPHEPSKVKDDNLVRRRKNSLPVEKTKRNTSVPTLISRNETQDKEQSKPLLISAKGIVLDKILQNNESKHFDPKPEHGDELTIDLKGNIIATKTSCHAFIGTVFSNVVHHTPDESLQDFILAELSLFCKGLLSSCRGVDVILL